MAPVIIVRGDTAAAVGDRWGLRDRHLRAIQRIGREVLLDCRPIGVGEVIEGAAGAAPARGIVRLLPSARPEKAGSLEFSIAGICGALPVSSSVIAILKVPSTITTTLAPTSSERILEVMVDGSLPSGLSLAFAAALLAARAAFSLTGARRRPGRRGARRR